MSQLSWRMIIVIILIVPILAFGGCAKKKFVTAGPGCPNDPGIAFIKFGDGQWQNAQNLPWARFDMNHFREGHIFGFGVVENNLLRYGSLSMPSPTSIEIATYFSPSKGRLIRSLNSELARQAESFGLKAGEAQFSKAKAWFRDNQCSASVHDKCAKNYIWLVIDPIPCNSKYQVLYAPGIGAEDFLVIQRG